MNLNLYIFKKHIQVKITAHHPAKSQKSRFEKWAKKNSIPMTDEKFNEWVKKNAQGQIPEIVIEGNNDRQSNN
ncbi:MAG: hypothetical protein WCY09_10320, partial [Candidatus Omnitrophota bacterium]